LPTITPIVILRSVISGHASWFRARLAARHMRFLAADTIPAGVFGHDFGQPAAAAQRPGGA
jgi:hypothetical protein